jgi:hypothetical protein
MSKELESAVRGLLGFVDGFTGNGGVLPQGIRDSVTSLKKAIPPEQENSLTVEVGQFRETYAVIETNAPRSYDYDYCIPGTGEGNPDKGSSRFVLIPLSKLEYQKGRYRSGLFWSKPIAPADFEKGLIEEMTNLILGRIQRTL